VRLLLDTHALIWLMTDDVRLGAETREIIVDPANDVFVSIVSFWEMAVKMRAGKLSTVGMGTVMEAVTAHGINLLALEPHHVTALLKLPVHADHRDPFDHQLIAQAIADRLVFVTADRNAHRYEVERFDCGGKS
jgi:PIN domain nuclease of toxin-antitoxin system